jgi:hypothetical protein
MTWDVIAKLAPFASKDRSLVWRNLRTVSFGAVLPATLVGFTTGRELGFDATPSLPSPCPEGVIILL